MTSAVAVEQRSISGLILAAMERLEAPDPNGVAELVLQDMTEKEIRHAAIRGVAERVRVEMGRQRHGNQNSASGRWDTVKQAKESGELDLARISVWTGAAHKWLLDCSAGDLEAAADEHVRTALGHERSADQLGKLASALRRAKSSVVGDLPEDRVRKILDA